MKQLILLIYKYTYIQNKTKIANLTTEIKMYTLLQLEIIQKAFLLVLSQPRLLIFVFYECS